MIDNTLLTQLRCPNNGEPLHVNSQGHIENASGSERYPIIHGIPDFRRFDPPYLTRAEEAQVADRMAEASARLTYDELIVYLETDLYPRPRSDVQIRKSIEHRRALLARSPQRLDSLLASTGGAAKPRGLTLDLGCGSGEATAALYQRGAETVIGLDISLVELMLAKKLLLELGEQAHLVAGCAESLPFDNNQFDFIYSPDVIEHVADQLLYIRETQRILKPNGEFLLNSPNRYSVVCPEPHVGIWFLGFLPRVLMDPVCRFVGRGGYTGKRLVSLVELRRLLESCFADYRIYSRTANPHATSMTGKVFYFTRFFSEPAYAFVCDQHVIHVKSK